MNSIKKRSQKEQTSEFALESIISKAIQIPGVKVDRQKFLAEIFAKEETNIQAILEAGPVAAGCSREILARMANKLILTRTSASSAASFAMGIPGGLAIGATIPADVVQFFGMSLRLAQELSYLYGAQDLWQDGKVDSEAVQGQLILYCGVMFGVSAATSGVRLLAARTSAVVLKQLPQKALTKTLWYPIVKQTGKLVGVKVTKSTLAKGLSKAIPVVGGVISGGLNFASMLPMANRLAAALDKASFDYTESEILADYRVIQDTAEEDGEKETGQLIAKFAKIDKLREMGILTQEEYEAKKAELLSQI